MQANSGAAPVPKRYKVVLLGDSGVGKSSLVQRLKGEWNENLSSTVGASFYRYTPLATSAAHAGAKLSFDIWDTAGQERYRSLASMYYRGAAAAVITYDLTSHDSFEHAKYWVRELQTNSPDTLVLVFGNKKDLGEAARQVPAAESQAYCVENALLRAEGSAKNAEGVVEAFDQIALKLLETNSVNSVREGGVVGQGNSNFVANSSANQKKEVNCCI
ncbi:Rab family, other [Strigomonas culicis]|uniref:Rab family, other n=1 Tax=Strigomonas culicis TaxID=28005 RepID=S9W1C2_9TRYP|nr:Rab family, other [Strigomonas culicis]EPY33191.1 Rab family, other [Strigomonas culicis]|eukprot:EPY25533.1 Rab family, other [Strigomonas culicis]